MSRRAAPSTRKGVPVARASGESDAYWSRSMRPLHMLVFLTPLVLVYELGTVFFLTDAAAGVQRSVEAHKLFGQFFHLFGLAGVFLPGVALASVLVIWHFMLRDRWTIDWRTIAGMFVESLMWTLPLLVLAAVADHSRGAFRPAAVLEALAGAGNAAGGVGGGLQDLPLMTRLTIAIGAGLYEEMLFRLVGLALLHFILVDLIAAPPRSGMVIAVVLAALGFALYHRPVLPDEWGKMLFYTLSGLFLGAVYTMRGFGIAVGTHALYDIMVLVVFPSLQAGASE